MADLTVSLPEDLQRYVDEKLEAGSYNTPDDFIVELVRRDRELDQATQARVASLLREALDTPAAPMSPDQWQRIRREGAARIDRSHRP